jgi:hypothetical protein
MLLALATLSMIVAGVCQVGLLRLRGLDAVLGGMLLIAANVLLVSLLLAAVTVFTTVAISVGSTVVAMVSVAARIAWGPRSAAPMIALHRPPLPRTSVEWVAAALCALVLVHLVVRAVLAIRLVPYGFDALSYHLAAVGWLVQDGRLPGPAAGIVLAGYPLYGELLAAWPAVLLHDDALSRVSQVLTAFLGCVATVGLARALGAHRPASVIAGCVFVLTPALLAQASTAYVDVSAAAFTVATYCFLIRWVAHPDGGERHLLLAGLAGGLAMGTKTTGLLVVLAAAFVVIVVGLRHQPRTVVRVVCAFILPAIVAGGFWYVRNLLTYGNPVYPLAIAGLPGAATAGDLLTPAPGPALSEPLETIWSWAHDLLPQRSYTYEQRVAGSAPRSSGSGSPASSSSRSAQC